MSEVFEKLAALRAEDLQITAQVKAIMAGKSGAVTPADMAKIRELGTRSVEISKELRILNNAALMG